MRSFTREFFLHNSSNITLRIKSEIIHNKNLVFSHPRCIKSRLSREKINVYGSRFSIEIRRIGCVT